MLRMQISQFNFSFRRMNLGYRSPNPSSSTYSVEWETVFVRSRGSHGHQQRNKCRLLRWFSEFHFSYAGCPRYVNALFKISLSEFGAVHTQSLWHRFITHMRRTRLSLWRGARGGGGKVEKRQIWLEFHKQPTFRFRFGSGFTRSAYHFELIIIIESNGIGAEGRDKKRNRISLWIWISQKWCVPFLMQLAN